MMTELLYGAAYLTLAAIVVGCFVYLARTRDQARRPFLEKEHRDPDVN